MVIELNLVLEIAKIVFTLITILYIIGMIFSQLIKIRSILIEQQIDKLSKTIITSSFLILLSSIISIILLVGIWNTNIIYFSFGIVILIIAHSFLAL